MTHRLGEGRAAAAALVAVVSLGGLVFAACGRTATESTDASTVNSDESTTTPRLADGHADLNGYWNGAAPNPNAAGRGNARGRGGGGGGGGGRVMNRYEDGSIIFDFSTEYNEENGVGRICLSDDCQASNQPPYNAEWMVKVREIAKTQFGGTTPLDPIHDCRPSGVPRAGVNGVQIVHTPQVVAVLYEAAPYSTYRLIYTDGRKHPADLETSYWGHSIGRWDGDTLVVDVVGLSEDSWVGGGGATGRNIYTSIHSDQLHVVERWTRAADVLTVEVTAEDAVAFSKPWVLAPRRVRLAAAGEEIFENICTANKDHFVPPRPDDPDIKNRCGYRCEEDAPDAASTEAPATTIAGTWDVTTRMMDRVVSEQWTIQQKVNAITATAKSERGEMPVAGSIEGAFVRVTVKDTGGEYKVRATVDGDAMDGSITFGPGKEYLWHAKRTGK